MPGKCSNGLSQEMLTLASLIYFLFSAAVLAQNGLPHKAEKDWKQICAQAAREPLPVPSPGSLDDAKLAACDETKLYYGLGDVPDYAAAMQCGWFQYSHPQNRVGNMFYGPGVLSMLYANGNGVERDYGAAIRLTCENAWASDAEMAYRISHLQRLRENSTPGHFDLCDDITSGLSDGYCTSIQSRTADNVRSKQIAALVHELPSAAQDGFPALQKAELAYETARIEWEVDLSGTSRGAFQLTEEAKLRDQFLINLQRFSKKDIPQTSKTDLAVLNQRLEEAFRRLQNAPANKWEFGTIKPAGIREAQVKWAALLDAWIDFSRLAYPELSETSLRAQLIRLRLHQLRSLYLE